MNRKIELKWKSQNMLPSSAALHSMSNSGGFVYVDFALKPQRVINLLNP